MITTVTLNPCIDKSVTIEGFTYGGMNRIIDSRIDPSGKGINVAIAYSQLGGQALCTGINYRVNGDLVEQRLDKAGIGHDFVTVNGEVRINHKGDYLKHWLKIGEKADPEKLPKLFYVNWFRKDDEGNWLWPGFGENSRVLKWIFERTSGEGKAVKTPIGYMPTADAIDTDGLDVSEKDMNELLAVDKEKWLQEVESIKEYYKIYGERLPEELAKQLAALEERLHNS
jgi:hypothetical protein